MGMGAQRSVGPVPAPGVRHGARTAGRAATALFASGAETIRRRDERPETVRLCAPHTWLLSYTVDRSIGSRLLHREHLLFLRLHGLVYRRHR